MDSKDSLWNWTENDLLPSLYNTKWYNGEPFEYKEGFISDKQTFMLGMPRLRQLRVKKGEFDLYLNLKHTNLIDVIFQNISLLFWLAQIPWLICHNQLVYTKFGKLSGKNDDIVWKKKKGTVSKNPVDKVALFGTFRREETAEIMP